MAAEVLQVEIAEAPVADAAGAGAGAVAETATEEAGVAGTGRSEEGLLEERAEAVAGFHSSSRCTCNVAGWSTCRRMCSAARRRGSSSPAPVGQSCRRWTGSSYCIGRRRATARRRRRAAEEPVWPRLRAQRAPCAGYEEGSR